MNYAFLVVVSVLFIACNQTYIMETTCDSKYGIETQRDTIKAKNNTDAYIFAYKEYCFKIKVAETIKSEHNIDAMYPSYFFLYDKNNEMVVSTDIPDSVFVQIRERYFSEYPEFYINPQSHIDSNFIKRNKSNFTFYKDEFDKLNRTIVSRKESIKNNSVYSFFIIDKEGSPSAFWLSIGYKGKRNINMDNCVFSYGGNLYSIENIFRNYNGGNERGDYRIKTLSDIIFLESLIKENSAKIQINGRFSIERDISQKEIDYIKETLELFFSMGGTLGPFSCGPCTPPAHV